MKKLLILLTIFLLTLISCEFPPTYRYTKLMVKGTGWDVYWQFIKDGGTDSGYYTPYPKGNITYYDVEPGDGYTIRLYRVTETIMEGGAEKRIIGETYETYFVIDHWITTISVTWTKEDGLGCRIETEGDFN